MAEKLYENIGLEAADSRELALLGPLPRTLKNMRAAVYHATIWRDCVTRMFLRALVGLYVYGKIDSCHTQALYYCADTTEDLCRYVAVMSKFWESDLATFLRKRFRRAFLKHRPALEESFEDLRRFTSTFMAYDALEPPCSTHTTIITNEFFWCQNVIESRVIAKAAWGRVRWFVFQGRLNSGEFSTISVFLRRTSDTFPTISGYLDVCENPKKSNTVRIRDQPVSSKRWHIVTFFV